MLRILSLVPVIIFSVFCSIGLADIEIKSGLFELNISSPEHTETFEILNVLDFNRALITVMPDNYKIRAPQKGTFINIGRGRFISLIDDGKGSTTTFTLGGNLPKETGLLVPHYIQNAEYKDETISVRWSGGACWFLVYPAVSEKSPYASFMSDGYLDVRYLKSTKRINAPHIYIKPNMVLGCIPDLNDISTEYETAIIECRYRRTVKSSQGHVSFDTASIIEMFNGK